MSDTPLDEAWVIYVHDQVMGAIEAGDWDLAARLMCDGQIRAATVDIVKGVRPCSSAGMVAALQHLPPGLLLWLAGEMLTRLIRHDLSQEKAGP